VVLREPPAHEGLFQKVFCRLVDDEDRENEGDLTMAAQFATPEAINFMAVHGRGLICLSITPERAEAMRLQPMVRTNQSRFGTAFTVSIEAREGVTTGISAADRARTIQVAVDPESRPEDLVQPGHVFPLIARSGGVLARPARRRRRSILPAWPGSSRRGSSARS
jgi:3,4-dihydroxy 2-butanone 4-phosphate synthase / GTP cyclohydrolase II